jgi:succinate dehydrogenase / fumarate reductase membrane anchor subunit
MANKKHRDLGSAKSGTEHFWRQRLTAIALIPLVIFFIGLLPQMAGANYQEFRALLGLPVAAVAMVLLVGIGLWHMKLGLQVVIEDYVHHEGLKMGLLIALLLATGLLATAGIVSIILLAV